MSFVVVIPARYASTRLPGKPLREINGKPMIEHVYRRGRESGARDVVIATDDERIAEAGEGFGANVFNLEFNGRQQALDFSPVQVRA